MTAHDILRHWRPISPVFGQRPSAWLALLEVCAAGEKGLSAADFARFKQGSPKWRRKMCQAGILTTRMRPNPGHRSAVIYTATPKAYALLRISAE